MGIDTSKFKTKQVEMTNGTFKTFYDRLGEYYRKEVPAELAYVICRNLCDLAERFAKMSSRLYDPAKDPEYARYAADGVALAERYADRDEQGNVVRDGNGTPVITDQLVEFREAVEKYNKENSELVKRAAKAPEYNRSVLAEKVTLPVYGWASLDGVPDIVIPADLFGFLMDDLFE